MWAPERRILKPQFWNHNFEREPQYLAGNLPLFSQAIPSLACCRVEICVKSLGRAQFLPGDQEFLSWLHPLHSCSSRCVPLARGCCSSHPGLLWGRQPGAAAAGLLLIPHGAKSGTSPPRSAVLPSHKATVWEADYPGPDVTFCSGAGTEWVWLSAPSELSLGSSAWDPGEPASIYCLSTLFFQEMLFLNTGLAPLKNVLLK